MDVYATTSTASITEWIQGTKPIQEKYMCYCYPPTDLIVK